MVDNVGNPWRDEGWVRLRDDTEHPKSPRCKLHLQRICGTCKHFQGELRQVWNHPEAAPTARCAYFGIQKARHAKAWTCTRWERPSKEPSQ